MASKRPLLSEAEAEKYGFEWTTDTGGACRLQVERMAELDGGRRVVSVRSERDEIHVYVTRTGLMRAFRDGKELR